MTDWIEAEITKVVNEYGEVPPLWIIFPDEHPYSMCWRMGYGESYVDIWGKWWREQHFDEAQRINYFHRWTPPDVWLKWTIEAIWELRAWEDDDFDYTPYFDRLLALGFGGKEDYEKDLSDPKWFDAEDDE
ncbi:hypothetical protein [Chamaesiphon sp.]|uniref:hypothetical protein n=1 Tax=Chamaesiphon sp. TaxID=2814140 RepID=UPI003593245E